VKEEVIKKKPLKTVGMAVRPKTKMKLLEMIPDCMTQIAYFEIISDYVLSNAVDFKSKLKVLNKARLVVELAAAENALAIKHAGELEALRLKYS
jgi:hypothetical protein